MFQITICCLCRWCKYDAPIFALPAGFLAGAAYFIQPNLTVTAIAIANFIQVNYLDVKNIYLGSK